MPVIADNWIDKMIEREATPKALRSETTRDFCLNHSLPERTYYDHARKAENQKKILEIALRNAKADVPEVLQKLADNAKAGKEKSIEMYLKFVAELVDKLDLTSKGDKILFVPGELMTKNGISQSTEGSSKE